MRRLMLLFAVLTICGLLSVAQATEVYVTTTGSNANTGFGPANPRATITEAITDASVGDTIRIGVGTFTENINLNKRLVIIGSGSTAGGTIMTQSAAGAGNSRVGVIQLTASGTSANPIVIKDLRIALNGIAGISVGEFLVTTNTVDVSYFTFTNVQVLGTNTNPASEQDRGLYVGLTSSLRHVTITNCAFNNCTYGWYLQKEVSTNTSTVEYLTVTGTTFNHNNFKGIYAEKLSETTFNGCEIADNGFSPTGLPANFLAWMCGVDINLKAGTYNNIQFLNSSITGNGLGGAKEGVGIALKARDDGATYGTYPASCDVIIIDNCTITGNERGVRIGEPGKNNAGPTNVTISNSNIYGNVQTYSGSDGTAYGDAVNQSSAQVTAKNNWWGTSTEGSIRTAGDFVIIPWYSEEISTVYFNLDFTVTPRVQDNTVSLDLYINGDAVDLGAVQFDVSVPSLLNDSNAVEVVHYGLDGTTVLTDQVNVTKRIIGYNGNQVIYRFVFIPQDNDLANLFHAQSDDPSLYRVLKITFHKENNYQIFNMGQTAQFTISNLIASQVGGTKAWVRQFGTLNNQQTISHRFRPDGDVNNDGVVDVLDVMLVMRHILGFGSLYGANFATADLNQDNELDVTDIMLLINIINGVPIPMIPGTNPPASLVYRQAMAHDNQFQINDQVRVLFFSGDKEQLQTVSGYPQDSKIEYNATGTSLMIELPTAIAGCSIKFTEANNIQCSYIGYAVVATSVELIDQNATANIAPNPSNGQVTITNPFGPGTTLTLVDLNGRIVTSLPINDKTMNYQFDLSSGNYYYLLSNKMQQVKNSLIIIR